MNGRLSWTRQNNLGVHVSNELTLRVESKFNAIEPGRIMRSIRAALISACYFIKAAFLDD